jgi:thiamine phosphate synthase YjbQ (UPF0047 family)
VQVRPDLHKAFELMTESASAGSGIAASRLQAVMMGRSLLLPLSSGRPVLGTWQGIYLANFSSKAVDCEVACVLLPAQGENSVAQHTAPSRGCHALDSALHAVDLSQGARSCPSCCSRALPNPYYRNMAGNVWTIRAHAGAAVLVHLKHTSAALTVTETQAQASMELALNVLVPEAWNDRTHVS